MDHTDQVTKSHQSKQQIQQTRKQANMQRGVSKVDSYFSGLSGNLIRSSWFLYDRFSNVRIIFFTELSSSGSSWNKDSSFSVQGSQSLTVTMALLSTCCRGPLLLLLPNWNGGEGHHPGCHIYYPASTPGKLRLRQ